MHFHLPKPSHGWREFAGEVGIIVIGILLALAAEQLIESLRDRARADETMTAIRSEVSDHDIILSVIEEMRPCVDAQLNAIEKHLVCASASNP